MECDPRDAFMRDLDLPRGVDREIVRDRDHEYTLRASETRTLTSLVRPIAQGVEEGEQVGEHRPLHVLNPHASIAMTMTRPAVHAIGTDW